MTRYKLKQVQKTDEIEQRLRQNVKQQLKQPTSKRAVHIPILTIIVSTALIFLLFQLLSTNETQHRTANMERFMHVFQEVKGEGVTYNQSYMNYDQQHIRTLRYYKEVPYSEFLQGNNVAGVVLPKPFKEKEGNVIAVNDGFLTELQLHFEHEDEFINISMAKTYMSPIDYATLAENPVDAYGTAIELERLNADATLVKKFLQGGGGLVYKYYAYDQANNRVHLVATTANEFYTILDGFIYYIGFSQNSSLTKEQMTDFAKDFILNNELKTLNFEEVTYESTWLTRGGKAMLVCFVIAVMSFALFVPLLRARSQKVQKISWSLIWIFLHAPILTWLISFSVGTLYRDGFAAIGMLFIAYPALFVIGLLIIWLVKSRVKWLVVLHVLTFIFAVIVSIWNGYYIEY